MITWLVLDPFSVEHLHEKLSHYTSKKVTYICREDDYMNDYIERKKKLLGYLKNTSLFAECRYSMQQLSPPRTGCSWTSFSPSQMLYIDDSSRPLTLSFGPWQFI